LPADLPASVFVVQHTSEEAPGLLARTLAGSGTLPAVTASGVMPLEHGRIVVAPPNRHLVLTTKGARVVFGPRENRSRPAIDPLFRTAAVNYTSRVIGVVLTGMLSDGAAGLLAVRRCGGAAVVQAPSNALYDEMPRSALSRVPDAHRVRLADLASLLARLTAEPAPPPPDVPESLRIEARLTERAAMTEDWNEVPGSTTDFTCPECSGAIQAIEEEGTVRYRCRVGHAYSPQDMLAAKGAAVEHAVWVALQTLEERAHMLDRIAGEQRGIGRSADPFDARARETRQHAEQLRELLTHIAM
jgi:two-component system chemotaxis response regulator CheB